MAPLVIFHADCLDGHTAAWVARTFLPDGTEFVPARYGDPPPDVTDREVYVLDFSYKRPVMERLRRQAFLLTVLDHHLTAWNDLKDFGHCEPGVNPNVACVFDMTKSGARLTWEHFRGQSKAPWLVEWTEDRDLWRWRLPESRAVNAALASYPRTFEEWDRLNDLPEPVSTLAPEGQAILRYQKQLVDAACANAVEIDLDGHKVRWVNATLLISEIGEQLSQGRPFSATSFVRGDGKKVWSLRSQEGGVDVSEVAKAHGGGGHARAAGFTE